MGFVKFYIICGYLLDEKDLRVLAGGLWDKYKKRKGYKFDEDLYSELAGIVNKEGLFVKSDLKVFEFPCCYKDDREKKWILGKKIATIDVLKLQTIDYSKFVETGAIVDTEIKKLKLPQPSGKIVYQLLPDDCYSC